MDSATSVPPVQLHVCHINSDCYVLQFNHGVLYSPTATQVSSPLAQASRDMADSGSTPLKSGFLEDVILWRRKKLSLFTLFLSTATWVLLDLYQYKFMTILCWAWMAATTLLFLWGNILRLLSKTEPDLSRLYITEELAAKMGTCCKEAIEEGIRWTFHVTTEKEWFVFAGTILGMWIFSYIGSSIDLQTFIFLGTLTGLTVPATWQANERRIKELSNGIREISIRAYDKANKVISNRFPKPLPKEKEKKTE